MAEKTFPVVIDGDTPTLFVNTGSVRGQIAIEIERVNGGLVKISLQEARKLVEVLQGAIVYVSVKEILTGEEK